MELRQHSLSGPCNLPLLVCQQDFLHLFRKGKPYMRQRAVFAVVFMWQGMIEIGSYSFDDSNSFGWNGTKPGLF